MVVALEDFHTAYRRIRDDILRTPVVTLRPLPEVPPITFKLELFQHTGSFKVRGVLNKLATLAPEEMAAGVISMSSGNHAQGGRIWSPQGECSGHDHHAFMEFRLKSGGNSFPGS